RSSLYGGSLYGGSLYGGSTVIVYLLILTAWVLELKSVAISFRGLPERLRSETVPVSSWQIDRKNKFFQSNYLTCHWKNKIISVHNMSSDV
ncbi:hypothetical protein BpHYR1_046731, partial [Brachionus plicatilis]